MDELSITLTIKLQLVVKKYSNETLMLYQTPKGYVEYTYQEFYQKALSIAYALFAAGIKRGDRVALSCENRPEWGMVYFGILLAGAIAVPFDPQASQEDIHHFLTDSSSRIVFSSSLYIEKIMDVVRTHRIDLLKIILVDDIKLNDTVKLSEFIAGFENKLTTNIVLPKAKPEDVASILYTSGTTGKPKGVMLTHHNFYSNFYSIHQLNFFTQDHHNILSILPLHHSFPFMVTLIIPLFEHSRITYIPSLKSDDILTTMQETKVTVLVGVPQFYYMFHRQFLSELNKKFCLVRWSLTGLMKFSGMFQKITGIRLSKKIFKKLHQTFGESFRYFVCGGAKLDTDIVRFFSQLGFTFIEGYGLTETSPIDTFMPIEKQKYGSVGKAIPDVSLKIVDADQQGIGEVAISGPNVMKGYFQNEEATNEVIKDGWFHSGDLGYLDKEGFLFLTGRQKELIVLGSGKNITPEEVEKHYLQCPYINELCVLPVGQGDHEKLVAVIVPNADYFREKGEVNFYGTIKWHIESLSKQYPAYKRIMGFVMTKEPLPRTRLGKLQRFLIKDQYSEELLGMKEQPSLRAEESLSDDDVRLLASPEWKVLGALLKDVMKIQKEIHLNDHLEIDLGIDSLARVELQVAVEKQFAMMISNEEMARIFTMNELLKKIIESKSSGVTVSAQKELGPVWKEILNTDPSPAILNKIDLHPGFFSKLAAVLFCKTTYFIFKLLWRIKIKGSQHLPKDEPFILCANHCNYLDAFFIASSIPNWLSKKMFFVGYWSYFDVPIIRHLIKIARIISIDPGARLIDAMQASAYVVRHEKVVAIFPEGARSIDGSIQPFKKGVGILAKELNVRLIPVYIKGSYESWPRTKKFPKPYPITITFGEPCDVASLQKEGQSLGAGDDYAAIAAALREKIISLKK